MKKVFGLLAALTVLFSASMVLAADSDGHTVTVNVSAINEVAITGGNVTLTINNATAGAEPDDATDTSTSLDWTTNEQSRKITVVSDNATPNFTLKVQATGVTGGTGAGEITVTDSAQDFVTGIAETTGSATLSYTASATASAGDGSDIHTVTYTITATGV